MNADRDVEEAGTRTEVEANEGTQDWNGDESGDEAGTGTGTRVEILGRTQDGNGDGSGDGNESSSGDRNRDEDGNGDGNEDVIGESGGKAKKRKKWPKRCRHDQALSFHTRHLFCKQGVVLAGTRQLRSQGPVSVHAYRTEGVIGSEGREGANGVGSGISVAGEIGNWNGVEGGNGDVNVDENGDEAGTRMELEVNEGTQYGNGDGIGDEAGTGRELGWSPADEHRMQTGMEVGTETRTVAGMGTVTRMGTGTRTRTGSRRVKNRRRSQRNRYGKRERLGWK